MSQIDASTQADIIQPPAALCRSCYPRLCISCRRNHRLPPPPEQSILGDCFAKFLLHILLLNALSIVVLLVIHWPPSSSPPSPQVVFSDLSVTTTFKAFADSEYCYFTRSVLHAVAFTFDNPALPYRKTVRCEWEADRDAQQYGAFHQGEGNGTALTESGWLHCTGSGRELWTMFAVYVHWSNNVFGLGREVDGMVLRVRQQWQSSKWLWREIEQDHLVKV